jgi:transcriptional regulator with XRE-family HTH domain
MELKMADDFPSVLSKLRREKRVNQRTAAAALNISQALLSHYENGLREPGFDFIDSACNYYNVSADYLLGRSSVKLPISKSNEVRDAFLTDFSDVLAMTFAELDKGLTACHSVETEEIVANMISIFLYSIIRNYDKSGKFDIPLPMSLSLCDAAIKTGFARLLSITESKLSLTMPQRLKKMVETELALIINDWK